MLTSVGDIPKVGSEKFGIKTALICPDRSLTFMEIDCLAATFSAALYNIGIGSGDTVTLWAENGWRWIIAYYGVLRSGAVVNPINSMCTADEARFIMADCKSSLLITQGDKARALSDSCSRKIIIFGESSSSQSLSFDGLLAQIHQSFPIPDILPDQLAAICYTSGTTGFPKGAMLTHRNILTNIAMTSLMHGRSSQDVVVSALPLPHVYGNVIMNAAVQNGMTLALFPRFEEKLILQAIEQYEATLFEGVPTMYFYLLNSAILKEYSLSSLRLCTVGGQVMPPARIAEVEARFGCPLVELWGMTELAGLGTTHPHNGPRNPGSIGIPLPLISARIADLDNPDLELPRGEVGELMIKGPIVMQGYLNNPEASQEAITSHGWLHTGDLARQGDGGYIEIVDRKKDMILTAGYNVYPAEIERVLAQHPDVVMAAVGSVADDLKGEVAKAYIVRESGSKSTPDEIISFCRQYLAAYKVPRQIKFVPDLPKTSTGKIMRRELKNI
jgi:long-chain acyl-CoA synthetase